jgi:hypothetical protein
VEHGVEVVAVMTAGTVGGSGVRSDVLFAVCFEVEDVCLEELLKALQANPHIVLVVIPNALVGNFGLVESPPTNRAVVVLPSVLNQIDLLRIELLTSILSASSALFVD